MSAVVQILSAVVKILSVVVEIYIYKEKYIFELIVFVAHLVIVLNY
tara:strand:- start:391 stop:528 length:138 start_codon:yes stop_codon:yes gene_type:complete